MDTPSQIIDLMVTCGRTADATYPGLRERNSDAWMEIAAGYACGQNPNLGRKARAAGARVSPDTMACRAGGGFYAVSIIRDNPPVNEWREAPRDYGLITDQYFVAVPPLDLPGTVEPPPVEPPTTTLEARVSELEAWRQSIGRVTTTQRS